MAQTNLLPGLIFLLLAAATSQSQTGGGQNVDAGGHLLHVLTEGRGAPTVILESGLGQGLDSWEKVQPEVAKFTRVVAYDRAGLGKSEPGPKPRSARQIATELH